MDRWRPGDLAPPPKLKHRRSVASGYKNSCRSFLTLTTVTSILIITELIVDWFTFLAYRDLHLSDKVEHLVSYSSKHYHATIFSLKDLLLNLTDIFRYICLVGWGIFLLRISYCVYMLYLKKQRFQACRDGLPHKRKTIEVYGTEAFVLLGLLCPTLPILSILLLSQSIITCNFYLCFNNGIYVLCVCVSLISTIWRFMEIFLNSFYLHQDVSSSRTLLACRSVLVFFIIFVSSVACCNLVLLRGQENHIMTSRSNFLVDKLNIENYLSKQNVVMRQTKGGIITNITLYENLLDLTTDTMQTLPSMPCKTKDFELSPESMKLDMDTEHCYFRCMVEFDDLREMFRYNCEYFSSDMKCSDGVNMKQKNRKGKRSTENDETHTDDNDDENNQSTNTTLSTTTDDEYATQPIINTDYFNYVRKETKMDTIIELVLEFSDSDTDQDTCGYQLQYDGDIRSSHYCS